MNFKEHKKHGITAGIIALVAYLISAYLNRTMVINQQFAVYCGQVFLITLAGSFAPDLDTKSTPQKISTMFLALCWGVTLFAPPYVSANILDYLNLTFYSLTLPTFVLLVCLSSKHRTLTHVLLWPWIFAALFIFTKEFLYIAFAIGLQTHYGCDDIDWKRLKNWYFNPFRLSNWF